MIRMFFWMTDAMVKRTAWALGYTDEADALAFGLGAGLRKIGRLS